MVVCYVPEYANLLDFAGKPVGTDAALFISQLDWLVSKSGRADADGWVEWMPDDIQKQTGLTRNQQETVRKKLEAIGLLEGARRGDRGKLHFRLLRSVSGKSTNSDEFQQNSSLKTSKQDDPVSANPANANGGIPETEAVPPLPFPPDPQSLLPPKGGEEIKLKLNTTDRPSPSKRSGKTAKQEKAEKPARAWPYDEPPVGSPMHLLWRLEHSVGAIIVPNSQMGRELLALKESLAYGSEEDILGFYTVQREKDPNWSLPSGWARKFPAAIAAMRNKTRSNAAPDNTHRSFDDLAAGQMERLKRLGIINDTGKTI